MLYGVEIVRPMNPRDDEDDQDASCIEALELAHIQLVNAAVASGWGEKQVAEALLKLAEFHVALLRSVREDPA